MGLAPVQGWVFELQPMSFATVQYRPAGPEPAPPAPSCPDCGGDDVLAEMFAAGPYT